MTKLRFELSFKNFSQLEEKLKFCKLNEIKDINIPCKGNIKKKFLNLTMDYIKTKYNEFNVVCHYSLFHQYSGNVANSYKEFLEFIKFCDVNKKYEVLLISGSNKKKNFDVIDVLNYLKRDNLKYNFGIAYNPYMSKYFNNSFERVRYEQKISSGLINSAWLQYGTDIKLLESEINFLKKVKCHKKINLFGSLLIPSKQFLARFKFRPWKGVYISENYLNSLEYFYGFTNDLVKLYIDNQIIPIIETDFSSTAKLEIISKLINF